MPAPHDLDPAAMTEAERLAKRRYQAYFAFEMTRSTVEGLTGFPDGIWTLHHARKG